MKLTDIQKQKEFAEWALQKINEDSQYLFNIFWADEAHITLYGSVNTHNCRRKSARENLYAYIETSMHEPRLTVWCGFISSIIISPYLFEEPCKTVGWKTCTITGYRYLKMVQDYDGPFLREKQLLNTITFIEDKAPLHDTR